MTFSANCIIFSSNTFPSLLLHTSCFNKILVKFARELEWILRGDELNNSRTERWALFHVISSTWLIQSSNAMWFSLVVLIRHWTNYMHSRHGGNTNTNIKNEPANECGEREEKLDESVTWNIIRLVRFDVGGTLAALWVFENCNEHF